MRSSLWVLFLVPMVASCASVPSKRSAIDEVVLQGTDRVDEDDIVERIATAPSPKFLGLFRGVVYDYEIFDRWVLQRDLARIERYYRSRGYYDAHVRAGRVVKKPNGHVRVQIVVEEGEPARVREVLFDGIESLLPDLRTRVRKLSADQLPLGSVFDERVYEDTEARIRRLLTNDGLAYAKVTRDAVVDLVRHSVRIQFKVESGPKCKFGKLEIEGLDGLPEGPVRRALDIQAGEPYSTVALETARQAVLDLGAFTAVQVIPGLDGGDTMVPIRVKVELARLRSVRLGGGLEFDALKTDVHGVFAWEDRNLFGGMRRYSATLKPGVVFYPLRVNNWTAPTRPLPELKVVNEFRQPGFIEARTSGFVRPESNLFPVLLGTNSGPRDPVLGYLELKGGLGVDRVLWKLYARLSYNVQAEHPFAYQGERDPALRTVIISYPELVTNFDLTDSRVHPHKGVFIGDIFQVAGGPFGGHATDVSVQPDLRGYVPLGKRVTLAARAAMGFLFPFDYGSSVREDLTTQDRTKRVRDLQVVFFRGFFAGGPNSNRGYPLRGIGPYEFVPAESVGGLSSRCTGQPNQGDSCRAPVGGFTRWESSVELRFSVSGPISMALFTDAADVSGQVMDVRLNHPHLWSGLGARYDTPVGPIRLDVGYRIPGLQVLGGQDPLEKEPALLFGVAPIAFAFGIGESF